MTKREWEAADAFSWKKESGMGKLLFSSKRIGIVRD